MASVYPPSTAAWPRYVHRSDRAEGRTRQVDRGNRPGKARKELTEVVHITQRAVADVRLVARATDGCRWGESRPHSPWCP
jgi:hypothetical protein